MAAYIYCPELLSFINCYMSLNDKLGLIILFTITLTELTIP